MNVIASQGYNCTVPTYDLQKSIGDDLQVVQWGGTPGSAKHFKGVGSGVYEIVESHNTNTYRAVYAVKLGKRVYVLQAFQKKSNCCRKREK